MAAIVVAIYGFDGAAIWNLQHLLEPSYFKPRSVAVEIKRATMNFVIANYEVVSLLQCRSSRMWNKTSTFYSNRSPPSVAR
jgi:hypothetical protein